MHLGNYNDDRPQELKGGNSGQSSWGNLGGSGLGDATQNLTLSGTSSTSLLERSVPHDGRYMPSLQGTGSNNLAHLHSGINPQSSLDIPLNFLGSHHQQHAAPPLLIKHGTQDMGSTMRRRGQSFTHAGISAGHHHPPGGKNYAPGPPNSLVPNSSSTNDVSYDYHNMFVPTTSYQDPGAAGQGLHGGLRDKVKIVPTGSVDLRSMPTQIGWGNSRATLNGGMSHNFEMLNQGLSQSIPKREDRLMPANFSSGLTASSGLSRDLSSGLSSGIPSYDGYIQSSNVNMIDSQFASASISGTFSANSGIGDASMYRPPANWEPIPFAPPRGYIPTGWGSGALGPTTSTGVAGTLDDINIMDLFKRSMDRAITSVDDTTAPEVVQDQQQKQMTQQFRQQHVLNLSNNMGLIPNADPSHTQIQRGTSMLPSNNLAEGLPNLNDLSIAINDMSTTTGEYVDSLPSFSTFKQRALEPVEGLEIRSADTKGIGVYATRLIKTGETIVEEAALMVMPVRVREKNLIRKFVMLPRDIQEKVMSLSDVVEDPEANAVESDQITLQRVCKFNRVDLFCRDPTTGRPARSGRGLFDWISKINHSCIPNSMIALPFEERVKDSCTSKVVAMRDIDIGEEVTICYVLPNLLGHHATVSERRKHLSEQFAFECVCEICSLGNTTPDTNPTEIERKQLQHIRNEYQQSFNKGDLKKALDLSWAGLGIQIKNKNHYLSGLVDAHIELYGLLKAAELEKLKLPTDIDPEELRKSTTGLVDTVGGDWKLPDEIQWNNLGLLTLQRFHENQEGFQARQEDSNKVKKRRQNNRKPKN